MNIIDVIGERVNNQVHRHQNNIGSKKSKDII
jgi:hypothetical protein